MNGIVVGVLLVLGTGPGDAAEVPDEWKRYNDAADAAIEAHDFAKAEALLVQVVREGEKLGDDDIRLAEPLERLARLYVSDEVDRAADGEPLVRRAVAIREQRQGLHHPDLAETLLMLAFCRLKIDKEDKDVERLQGRALSILEKGHGKDDLGITKALHDLAIGHLLAKRFGPAEAALKRAIAIRERALGPDNAALATLLDDLGDMHFAQSFDLDVDFPETISDKTGFPSKEAIAADEAGAGRHRDQAEAFYRRALAIREKTLGPNDRKVADSLRNLAQLLMAFDRAADAEPYLARWLAIHEQAAQRPRDDEVEMLMMWSEAERLQEHWDEAERRFARAQTATERRDGPDSAAAAGVLAIRADIAISARRFDDAEKFLKHDLGIQAQLLGPDDPDVRQARTLLEGSYRDHASDPAAYRFWNQVEELSRRHTKRMKRVAYGLGDGELAGMLDTYATLLRQANRVVPQPTEADLAYLKRIHAVFSSATVDNLFGVVELMTLEPLHDEGLSHIARLYGLKRLDVSGQGITDAGLAHLAKLESLEELDLAGNPITDTGVAHLNGLQALHTLDLGSTAVTDAGIAHLEALKGLRELTLPEIKVTPTAVERLRRARPEIQVVWVPPPRVPAEPLRPPPLAPGVPARPPGR